MTLPAATLVSFSNRYWEAFKFFAGPLWIHVLIRTEKSIILATRKNLNVFQCCFEGSAKVCINSQVPFQLAMLRAMRGLKSTQLKRNYRPLQALNGRTVLFRPSELSDDIFHHGHQPCNCHNSAASLDSQVIAVAIIVVLSLIALQWKSTL